MNKDLIAKLLGIGLILAAVFFGKIWRPNAEDAKYNAHPNATRMIRIAITAEAFDALAATLPLGSIGFERHPADDGQLLVWLEPHLVNKLRALRGPGESYSDVILRLGEIEAHWEPH
jgi:hypothetical protein